MAQTSTRAAVIIELAKGFTLSEFYPVTHPTLEQALERMERDFLALGGEVVVAVEPSGLRIGREWVGWRSSHPTRLAARLSEHGVQTFGIQAEEVHADDLGRLLSATALPPRVVRAAGGLLAALTAAGARAVSINGEITEPRIDFQSEPGQKHGVNVDVAVWSAQQIYDMVRQTAVRVETESLEALRDELLAGPESERVEVTERLRQTAAWTVNQGGMEAVIGMVSDLRRAAEEMGRRNPAGRAHVMLALQKIGTRPVIEELVARLGKARSEEERTELQSALLHIGADVVTPLVQALTDASDMSARRAYRDALVVLDQVGIPLLEDMVGDERWFVVRNMVSILGEIRSADSLDHFARTIRHGDPRVRRETVLALTKLGGEESVPLLIRGLGDVDPGIRGTAALGLGLSRAPGAVPPLLRQLGSETEAEAEVEIIRALGHLGDLRAFPALRERAAASGWFSRRQNVGVRLEAIRALTGIAAAPVREFLEELTRDKVPDVRDAATEALRAQAGG